MGAPSAKKNRGPEGPLKATNFGRQTTGGLVIMLLSTWYHRISAIAEFYYRILVARTKNF